MAVVPGADPLVHSATQHGIPIPIARALVGQESGGNPNAVSSAGATGVTQVLPSTAAGMYGITPEQAAVKLKDPAFAYDAGFRYLSQQYKTFGNWRNALAAYNAGPGAVHQYHGVPPFAETEQYVRNILAKAGHSDSAPSGSAPGVKSVNDQLAQPHVDAAVAGLMRIASGKAPDPVAELNALVHALPSAQKSAPTKPSFPISVEGSVTPRVKSAVQLVQQYLGTPYVWGGESPKGFDCSGLLQYVWSKKGVQIPRTTYDQFKTGTPVAPNQLQPGDAVFFTGSDPQNGLPGHVGMYIGSGRFIEAPHTGAVVRISNLAGRTDFAGARRYA